MSYRIVLSIFTLFFIYTTAMGQLKESPNLETVAEFGESMGLGLSVTSHNRIFVSFPNNDADGQYALVEVKNGKLSAYPTKSWNVRGAYDQSFLRIQDIYVDAIDNLWVLDSKPSESRNLFRDGQGDAEGKFKLVKINTQTDQVEKIYFFKNLDKENSALNDVRVDVKKGYAYLSDPGLAALVVLDLKTDKVRVLLKESDYTSAKDEVLTYDGQEMRDGSGKPFSSHVNGIALTSDFNYFYFKPINDRDLYRIQTDYLIDEQLTDEELKAKVTVVKNVGNTHGLIADKKGNVYLTTSENYSVSYVTPSEEVKTLVRDPRLLWPDSLGIGSDGFLYFSATQLQRLPHWNQGVDKTEYPYRIFRVKLP